MVDIKIIYDNIDISKDISDSLISLTYSDHVSGKSDEVEIKLEDTQGLYSNSWYPQKGSTLQVFIDNCNCGTFSIDEINISGSPDVVTWRGISSLITKKMRTANSKGYEKTTLLQIAQDIAKNHDLTVDDGTKTVTLQLQNTKEEQDKLGILATFARKIISEKDRLTFQQSVNPLMIQVYNIIQSLKKKQYEKEAEQLRVALSVLQADMSNLNAARLSKYMSQIRSELFHEPTTVTRTLGLGLSKIKVYRSTQNRETDLAYLSRLSSDYGLAFNIKPPQMVFYSLMHLESSPSVLTIKKTDITSFDFTDKTEGTYKDANVSYHDPLGNKTITNSTKRVDTITEQVNLQSLFISVSKIGANQNADFRNSAITGLNTIIINTIKGLKNKNYLDESQQMVDAYGFLVVDKSTFGCIRFANFCKNLNTTLKSLQKELVNENHDSFKGGQKSDTLVIRKKVENKEQADALAKSAIHKANSKTRTGNITMPGNILALAGNNFDKVGFGFIDGKYSIVSSVHQIDKPNGYTTSIEYKQGAIS